MKNIKCLLGHPLSIMKLHDVTKHKFDNNKENITVYKCKYCNQIITGKTNFIHAEFKDNKKVDEDKLKYDIRVKEYQGWSLNNTKNTLSIYGDNNSGYLHLVSKNEINAIEKIGLLKVLSDCFNFYQGYDIDAFVYKSEYDKEEDTIRGKYGHYGVSVEKASTHFSKYCNFKLENAETIITIQYHIVRRYKESKWWRFVNKRKCIIRNEMVIE